MENTTIHPSAIVHPGAKLGKNIKIGPFCYIDEHVELGDGCILEPNVTIYSYVKMGTNCKVFPGAIIGAIPQDLKFAGEVSWVEIGNNTVIRECATINRGTAASGKGVTKIGNNCFIMSYVHVAHDCTVHDKAILTSYVGLAGEVEVGEQVIVGGNSSVHQFSRIGAHAMLGGGSLQSMDVPPYVLAAGQPLRFAGVNVVGLRRRGFTNEKIEEIREIYRVIFNSGMNRSEACAKVEKDFPRSEERDLIVDFIRTSKRGTIRFQGKALSDE